MLHSVSLMPHAVCWAAAPRLIWTMVVTNMITFLSYLTICCTLLYLARSTRKVIARDWAWFLVGFALFIVACGLTHFLEVVTTWIPVLWVDAWVNAITAALSAYVALTLLRRISEITFSINEYGSRLAETQTQKLQLEEAVLTSQKLEDWSRLSVTLGHEIRGPLEAIQSLQYLIRTSAGVPPDVATLAIGGRGSKPGACAHEQHPVLHAGRENERNH